MTTHHHLRWVALLVFFGLVALSRDLWWAWQHAPYDRGAGWIAMIWLGGAAWLAGRGAEPQLKWILLGLALGLVGVAGELNVARHVALAVVVAAWIPTLAGRGVVLVGAAAWWPAFGWGLAQVVSGAVVGPLRWVWLALAGLASWWVLSCNRRTRLSV